MNGDFDEDFDFFEDIELPFDENDATCYDGYLGFVDIDRLPPLVYETKRYNKLKDAERFYLRGIVQNLIIEFWKENKLIPDGGEVNQIMNTAIRHFEEELSLSVKNDKDLRRIVQSMVVPTINKQLTVEGADSECQIRPLNRIWK